MSKAILIQPGDPAYTDFAGTITISGEQTEGQALAMYCSVKELRATPRGIGGALATMLRCYLDNLPEDQRELAALQAVEAMWRGMQTGEVIPRKGAQN